MPLTIDIISDVVCPWCFIGKRRLEAALASLRADDPTLEVSLRWHPFFLNPETPPEGDAYRPFLEKKFGGPEALQAIWQRVTEAGRSAGVDFAFDKITIRPNTLNAHRLLHRAQGMGKVDAWAERLFVGHFQRGEDIGNTTALAAIGAELGEDPAEIAAYLDSDADRAAVQAEVEQGKALGVSGVPFFIFNGRLAVSGAQPPEVLRQAIAEAMP